MGALTAPADDAASRWPAGFAPLAFFAALLTAALLGGLSAAIAVALGAPSDAPGVTLTATALQDMIFVAVPVLFAASIAPPRPWQFGLRRAGLRRVAAWVGASAVLFYTVAALYTGLLQPEGEQDVLDELGADQGVTLLVLSGLITVVAAPFAEEFFFRGFLYRALRNRYAAPVATAIIAVVFGAIHFSGSDTLPLLPLLALLGAVFCVLYERTGTLYAPIALHGLNNAIAFSATADAALAPIVGAGCGAVTLSVCALRVRRRGMNGSAQAQPA